MTMNATPLCVALLSGGLDSATAVAVAKSQGFGVCALTVRYQQRHSIELEAARNVAVALGVERHLEVAVDLRAIGGSSLTSELEVPKDGSDGDLPSTYVPARNTVLLSLALAWAEVLGAYDIFIGANAVDYSGYPDCRPEFITAFETLANVAVWAAVAGRGRVKIHAPLMNLAKADIIRLGLSLGVDYSLTHSCYDPSVAGRACGRCPSCRIRLRGFHDAGVADPVLYADATAAATLFPEEI